jgi:hypothetical protein
MIGCCLSCYRLKLDKEKNASKRIRVLFRLSIHLTSPIKEEKRVFSHGKARFFCHMLREFGWVKQDK